MNTDDQIQNRRAIEAMRAGVPNQDAVYIMGCSQEKLEKKFLEQLKETKIGLSNNNQAYGMLIASGFGSGKSHLLEYFQHLALKENFICSKFAISKETPLYDISKVYQSAIKSIVIPGKIGYGLTEIVTNLKFNDPLYANFYKWLNQSNNLSNWFAATVYLYENLKASEETGDRIIRFWSGDKLNISELKNWLKEIGETTTYKLDKIKAKELSIQRFLFTPRLIAAAGYSGWVLLIDEVELIGRYSRMQRARSYAKLANFLGYLSSFQIPGLSCVMAITDDFEAAVLDDKLDEEKIPSKLENIDMKDSQLLCSQAKTGMNLIRKALLLQKPDMEMINDTFIKLRNAYEKAYTWQPPAESIQPDITAPMRQNIKRVITIWDLRRIYPDYTPYIVTVPIKMNYEEESGLEETDNDFTVNE